MTLFLVSVSLLVLALVAAATELACDALDVPSETPASDPGTVAQRRARAAATAASDGAS